MQHTQQLTDILATFVVDKAIEWTPQLQQAVQDGITDWFASTLASHNDPTIKQLIFALGYNETGDEGILEGSLDDMLADKLLETKQILSTVIGKTYQLPALDAALINGYLAHALDYDDVHEDVRGHPSAVLLAALFAEAEHKGCSGEALMEGYLIGMEVMCQLGRLVGKAHYELGWHSTATLGVIAAATGVARMCRYNKAQTIQAISIAATQSSGLRLHFGTTIKPMHAGIAARSGLLAARMAFAGIEGASEVLEGPIGLLSLVTQGHAIDLTCIEKDWFKQWSILTPGLWFKKYPCCSAAYHALDAAHEIWLQHKLKAEDISQITLSYPPGGDTALIYKQPKNRTEGKFSAEYITALKLTQDELTLDDFSDKPISEAIQQLMLKTIRVYREDIQPSEHAMPKGRFTQIDVRLHSGMQLTAYCECPTGSPAKPMSRLDRQYKLELATTNVDASWIEIAKRIDQLKQLKQVSQLFV